MSEMVERVAQAIDDAYNVNRGREITNVVAVAKAAIKAMREPTERMLHIGENTVILQHRRACPSCAVEELDSSAPTGFCGCGETWQAMIDEALR